MAGTKMPVKPYPIKVVEPIRQTSRKKREKEGKRDKVRGLKIVREAPFLRHFTVRLEEV